MRAPQTDAQVNRLLNQKLPVFRGWWLPQLACYLPNTDRPVRKRHYRPVPAHPQIRAVNIIKPHGGLWTSPLLAIRNGPRMGVIGTNWSLRFHNPDMPVMYEIKARRNARVAVIHTHAHLLEMRRRYPLDLDPVIDTLHRHHANFFGMTGDPGYVDWHAASRDFDAVWITSNGIETCDDANLAVGLWNWSFETVFFLRPAFYVRRRTHPAMDFHTLYPPEDSMFANLIRAVNAMAMEEEQIDEPAAV